MRLRWTHLLRALGYSLRAAGSVDRRQRRPRFTFALVGSRCAVRRWYRLHAALRQSFVRRCRSLAFLLGRKGSR